MKCDRGKPWSTARCLASIRTSEGRVMVTFRLRGSFARPTCDTYRVYLGRRGLVFEDGGAEGVRDGLRLAGGDLDEHLAVDAGGGDGAVWADEDVREGDAGRSEVGA